MAYLRKNNGKYYQIVEKYFDELSNKWKIRILKSIGAVSKTVAKQALVKFQIELQNPVVTKSINESIKISDTINKYIEFSKVQEHNKRYIYDKTLTLNRLLASTGDILLKDFTLSHFECFQNRISKTKVKTVTINNIVKICKSFFMYCVEYEYLSVNPLARVKRIKEIQYELTIPTSEQIAKLIDTANLFWQHLLYVYIYTGCRRNEILNLQLKHIDFEKNLISVEPDKKSGFTTKSKKPRKIPIHSDLKPKLEQLVTHYINHITNERGYTLD